MVTVNVSRELTIKNTLPQYKLDQTKVMDVHKSLDTSNQYFGQPDMIRTKSGRLITSFPQGHGKGPLIMKISDDDGATWTRKTDIPASWAGSQETPTLYVLNLADGTERIMMITACPGWGTDSAGNRYGWNTSYSDDNGETWTEYRHWQSNRTYDNANNDAIVAMASLVQLKDSDGNDIQKWMGVYHNYAYVNFRTYLTFDENGDEQWSESEPYLAQWRSIESAYQMCEIGMFRSPDGKRIIGLARSQSHNNPATLIYSDDEGETWSKPMDLPGSLAGERHKIAYDPISGRLLVTFREINYDLNGNNRFDGGSDWNAGDWVPGSAPTTSSLTRRTANTASCWPRTGRTTRSRATPATRRSGARRRYVHHGHVRSLGQGILAELARRRHHRPLLYQAGEVQARRGRIRERSHRPQRTEGGNQAGRGAECGRLHG